MSTQRQPAPVTPSLAALVPLFEEAARATGSSRALMAGSLNALIARWAQTEDPAALAPALHALLAKEGVEQLVDEQGTPVSVAATQALLAMSYPHPLEVAPEHLEALRRQQEPAVPPTRRDWMLTVLVVATLVQAVCFILADDMRHLSFGLTVDELAGGASLPPPPRYSFLDGSLGGVLSRLERDVWWSVRPLVPWGQAVCAGVLYGFSTVLARTAWARTLSRRGFLGLGAVGFVAGLLPMHFYESWGTLTAAAGALLAGRMLRVPKQPAPPGTPSA
ncbi:hypothetical protein [Corallococcus sp. 4LFB]|uniref:hypothetical protein n=1 Tax=Corallococcus sp. 4LFB TaxID=3383249 RepID=UPI003974D5A2